jgi:hypothetical protein
VTILPAVLVSLHARTRALERAGIGVTLVAREVAEAVAAGRMAVHEPAWTGCRARRRADRDLRGGQRSKCRWVWPAEQSRAYLISRRRNLWVVVTVVAAAVDELAAA